MIGKNLRCMAALLLATNLALVSPSSLLADNKGQDKKQDKGNSNGGYKTTTPIKHLVVIFQENVSFDHYFGSYPEATNPTGEPQFVATDDTPTVNGLIQGQIDNNHNHDANNNIFKPVRLDRSQNYTCDNGHNYTPEQQAFDSGLLDEFPEFTACNPSSLPNIAALGAGIVMGYYDGNTVTAMWNYAQHFAMNDNSFGTNFGPSTPGALNVISGMTGGVDPGT